VENGGGSPVEVVLQSRIEADPGEIDDAEVVWGGGGRRLIRPEEQPTGSETYSGAAVPGGEWRVVNRGAVRLVNRFDPAQVERALLSWSGKGVHRVTLALWSKKRTLAPGESLRLDAGYEPR
jgi:hypothetical protein